MSLLWLIKLNCKLLLNVYDCWCNVQRRNITPMNIQIIYIFTTITKMHIILNTICLQQVTLLSLGTPFLNIPSILNSCIQSTCIAFCVLFILHFFLSSIQSSQASPGTSALMRTLKDSILFIWWFRWRELSQPEMSLSFNSLWTFQCLSKVQT